MAPFPSKSAAAQKLADRFFSARETRAKRARKEAILGRLETEKTALANHLLGVRKTQAKRARKEALGRLETEKLVTEVFGKRREHEFEQARRHERERRKARRHDRLPPEVRCWDWMLHEGNVHYARNASSFRKGGSTKLDLQTKIGLGFAQLGAIGIGTVDLIACRGPGAPHACAITLHDVLHVPLAPRNGVSIGRLQDADAHVATGADGCNMTHLQSTEQLFCGTRIGQLFRVSLFAEPQADSALPRLNLDDPMATYLHADAEVVARKGNAARELQSIKILDRNEDWRRPAWCCLLDEQFLAW